MSTDTPAPSQPCGGGQTPRKQTVGVCLSSCRRFKLQIYSHEKPIAPAVKRQPDGTWWCPNIVEG